MSVIREIIIEWPTTSVRCIPLDKKVTSIHHLLSNLVNKGVFAAEIDTVPILSIKKCLDYINISQFSRH